MDIITTDLTSVTLPQCLYRVYEAKQAAHIAHPSSVGEATYFEVLTPKGNRYGLNIEGLEQLNDLFKSKHGRVPKILMDRNCFIDGVRLSPLR